MRINIGAIIAGAIGLCASISWAEESNVLVNGDLATGSGKNVPGWLFPTNNLPSGEDASKVEWGVAADSQGGRALRVAATAPTRVRAWWQQELPAKGGAVYSLTVRVRGTLGEDGPADKHLTPAIGVYFYDASGKWLGFQAVPASATADGSVAQKTVAAPEDAARMGVRLGVYGAGTFEILFDHVVLTEAK